MPAEVKLYVYDISRGFAGQFSEALIGKKIKAVYHTSIVVYDLEFFYGNGIERIKPNSLPDIPLIETINLGTTELSEELVIEGANMFGEERYRPDKYNLLEHNCNNFSNDFAEYLVGQGIRQEILDLPKLVKGEFLAMFKPPI